MPPKEQNKSEKGIRTVFKKEIATTSDHNQETIPPEEPTDAQGQHSHSFTVAFDPSVEEYTISCDKPQTVLEAIKSLKSVESPDTNIVIQLGSVGKDIIVPTHFPCSCIGDRESLIISCKSEMIENAQNPQRRIIYPKDKYTVFYIDTVGGKNAKKKEIFQSHIVKKYKRLCVYGEKGMTVAEILKRDGRFSDHLGDFTLSDNANKKSLTLCTQKVNDSLGLDQKTFKIGVKKRQSDGNLQGNESSSEQCKGGERSAADIAQQCGISVKTEMEKEREKDSIDTTYDLLRKQFPKLREWMENRFTGDSYQAELELRKENFGKIQQSFSEVHRVKMLLKLGESVCKITVGDFCEGTGFVLFDRFIMTNAHLFTDQRVQDDSVEVCAVFDYEDPQPKTNFYYFTADKKFVDCNENLDYAILELNTEGLKSNRQTKAVKVPPGLLEIFGPLPDTGEACIIGHPAGGVKKMDPTVVIDKENSAQQMNSHRPPYACCQFIVHPIQQYLTNQGIENIMMGKQRENVLTYNTFMYHGASGSPVFDGLGRVVGLHTGGFYYGPRDEEHVIAFANPLLDIFKSFVGNLKKKGNDELLKRVKEVAKESQWLKRLLGSEPADPEEPMELD